MFKRSFLAVIAIVFIVSTMQAQVQVFADSKNDSIALAVKRLFNEFKKAGIGDPVINEPGQFKGRGVLLVLRENAIKQKITFDPLLNKNTPEAVYLKGDDQSVIIVGNTAFALQQGVYIYLQQLGFQYLLPGDIWQNIPKLSSVYKKFTVSTEPDFDLRTISNAHGYGGNAQIENDFYLWANANLLGGSFVARVGHAYDEIVTGNAEVFKQHPEYFAQTVAKGSLPENPKFNVANKDLVQLVVEDAYKRVELFKRLKWNTSMISMEPSDGGGFCTTAACKSIGTTSDQVFYLTNVVAKALQKKYPGVWTGGFAYNEHILPTKYKLEPNVFVMITNGFNRTNFSTAELLQAWGKKATKVGIYDYLSVYEWDNDLPGQIPVAKVRDLKKIVRGFYNNNAKSFIGESVMGWINKGPAQYVLAKLLWDVDADAEKAWNEFFESAYGNVAPIMKKVYAGWQDNPHRIPMDNDMADWMDWVDEAYNKASSSLIRQRLDQVKIYLHYVALYRNLKLNPSEDNLQKVLSFAYRNYESAAFATLPTLVSLPTYSGYQLLGWYAGPEQKWKADKRPYSSKEIQDAFQQDRKQIKRGPSVARFKKDFSFVKLSTVTKIPGRKFYTSTHTFWGKTEYVINIKKKGKENSFDIYSGMAANPPDERNVDIKVFTMPRSDDEDSKLILKYEQSKKGIQETFSLASLEPGTYKVQVDDKQKIFVLTFSNSIDYSIVMKPDDKLLTTSSAGLNIFYFYVPKGVKNFRVSKSVVLTLGSPTGRLINHENNKEETIEVTVMPGEDGGVWAIANQAGNFFIDGIPPYVCQHPDRMLVPAYLSK